ncbi:unnamed protein product [Sphenostylis stenocarpa]|uniref:Uncharacterized protein n=1 Tax=Sphenostylis stenocarpa TaxID=92480 RepID=A0AA86RPN5_9FABA|nr:unnamed protein product [Sphenostylis stenocarpa]
MRFPQKQLRVWKTHSVHVSDNMPSSSSPCCDNAVTVLSKSTVVPDQDSTLGDLKLSISDLNMLLPRNLEKTKMPMAMFPMAANVRQRLEPKLGDCYFENVLQSCTI